MMGFVGMRRSAAALVAFGCLSLPITTAWAADSCIATDNPCDPNKLCTFLSELAAKQLTYDTYRANRDSKGALYQQAISEAQGSGAAKLASAGSILQGLVQAEVLKKFKEPACNGGSLDRTLVPKPGYEGMHTDALCNVFADYQKGLSDAKGFGKNDRTSCPEFYDRDRAHEVIHQQLCDAARKSGTNEKRFAIDALVNEELVAYDHSVKLSQAYVRLLSVQCSAKRTPAKLKARAKELQNLLAPYLGKLR